MRNISSWLISISLSRDRLFRSTPKIGHELVKQPVTIDRNHWSRLSEMTGHDAPKYAAFITCSGNAKLLVLDLRSLSVIGVYTVGDDPDMLAYDPKRFLLYVASESGWVTLFRMRHRHLTKVGKIWLGDHAHSVEVDPVSGLAYFPVENDHGKPILLITSPSASTMSR